MTGVHMCYLWLCHVALSDLEHGEAVHLAHQHHVPDTHNTDHRRETAHDHGIGMQLLHRYTMQMQ
jgi:hypothetical protein